jgi:hypothetical protein
MSILNLKANLRPIHQFEQPKTSPIKPGCFDISDVTPHLIPDFRKQDSNILLN